ncbi:hypothetical protein ISF_08993 [Cordyceps fumosorosea ARSEF 2679]|uniref:Uncharacterized protein n=1 Tax=Cordyceps fumosorosea (strain ARSEF 2679) TaxID=1081104 RepID=A0A167LJB2_CORFA|nr:hypothetical protein ISF_08993 [Cordyceps fumosorosea ARSEF 2679]OAA53152.1 hypothetical protein ISF_08993 [Cordyceps fumosorosea ARSEF 2679]
MHSPSSPICQSETTALPVLSITLTAAQYTRVDVPGYGSVFLSDSVRRSCYLPFCRRSTNNLVGKESTSTFGIEPPKLDYFSDQSIVVSVVSLLSPRGEDTVGELHVDLVPQQSTPGQSTEPVSLL